MRGDGTRETDTRPEGLILDVSRSLYRRHPPTGIDRVEAAYIDRYGKKLTARIGSDFALMDSWPSAARLDAKALMQPWRSLANRLAETGIRRAARWRGPGADLPKGAVYLNVGHTNLERLTDIKIPRIVMLHDVIPLDHPEFQRPAAVARFREGFDATIATADAIIVPSSATRDRILDHQGTMPCPPIHVAHLGHAPRPAPTPPERTRPYFVAIGTLEPRKNIGFLLEIWNELGPDAPDLLLLGRRGWETQAFFSKLDVAVSSGRVFEDNSASDEKVWSLLAGARALLFPSHAEGFGLPLLEASALGVPVLASDLPVIAEIAPEATRLPTDAPAAWKDKIQQLAKSQPYRGKKMQATGWEAHFAVIDAVIKDVRAK